MVTDQIQHEATERLVSFMEPITSLYNVSLISVRERIVIGLILLALTVMVMINTKSIYTLSREKVATNKRISTAEKRVNLLSSVLIKEGISQPTENIELTGNPVTAKESAEQ